MILYYAPGACSLADHIALREAGLDFDTVRVDLKTHTTEDGRDYADINPKGYVPALVLDDGQLLTENIAILSWIADRGQKLGADGVGRYRLLETLALSPPSCTRRSSPSSTPRRAPKRRLRPARPSSADWSTSPAS